MFGSLIHIYQVAEANESVDVDVDVDVDVGVDVGVDVDVDVDVDVVWRQRNTFAIHNIPEWEITAHMAQT